jgi:hypothetical protein
MRVLPRQLVRSVSGSGQGEGGGEIAARATSGRAAGGQ